MKESMLQHVAEMSSDFTHEMSNDSSVLQHVAACCSMLQICLLTRLMRCLMTRVYCCVLQFVAVCYSMSSDSTH